jgi:Ca-activated chloride channel family protein
MILVSFVAPLWLLLAPAMALVVALTARRRERRRAELRPYGAPRRETEAGRRLEPLAAIAGAALLAVALAGPRRADGEAPHEPPTCVLVLDGSRSMLAEDVAPSRFAAARAELLARVRAEPGRRFGVVLFAGRARVVCPPTRDGEALARLVGDVDPRRVSDPGSDVARGIESALALLEEEGAGAAGGRGGEIVLLTDGEFDGRDEESHALVERARAAGVELAGRSFGGATPAPIVRRDASGAALGGEPATTLAAPRRLAELAPLDRAAGEPGPGAPPRHDVRVWAAAGLLLLAFAHGLTGREP